MNGPPPDPTTHLQHHGLEGVNHPEVGPLLGIICCQVAGRLGLGVLCLCVMWGGQKHVTSLV